MVEEDEAIGLKKWRYPFLFFHILSPRMLTKHVTHLDSTLTMSPKRSRWRQRVSLTKWTDLPLLNKSSVFTISICGIILPLTLTIPHFTFDFNVCN